MKIQRIGLAVMMACTALAPLHADIDETVFALEDIETPPAPPGPFELQVEFDSIAKASFNKKGFHGSHLTFGEYSASGSFIFLANKPCREFYSIAGGYTRTHLCWNKNPYFSQTQFNVASLALQFYSNRLCDWVWQGQLGFNVDVDRFDFNNYLTIDMLLWGRYEFSRCLGIHMGILAMTGMRMDRVYPIIGVDWKFRPCWKLNAVFPMNVSLEYSYSRELTPFIGLRFIDVRQRASKNAALPKALINYENIGAEAGVLYKHNSWIEGNVHAGTTVGGKLRIANKNNKSPRHFKINPSGYVGGELTLKF